MNTYAFHAITCCIEEATELCMIAFEQNIVKGVKYLFLARSMVTRKCAGTAILATFVYASTASTEMVLIGNMTRAKSRQSTLKLPLCQMNWRLTCKHNLVTLVKIMTYPTSQLSPNIRSTSLMKNDQQTQNTNCVGQSRKSAPTWPPIP